jgi:phage terminase large subunit-like protein
MDYREYAEAVVSGRIVACELTILACKRFLDDLERDDLIFKEKKVKTLLLFASVLHHYTGSHSGEPFILEPWQEMVSASIFGFYYKDTGRRKYTSSYIELARKQGKTFLASLFCLFALIADGEDGAEVLLAANSKEQARIAFEMTQILARQLDPRERELKVYRNEIKFETNNSKLKVLAADDSKLDGFNCSFGLLDEYHAAGNSKVRDVIKSSMGMRKNPHLATITTAGFNKSAPCYELRSYGIEVLKGIKEDDSFFCLIYTLDEGDDWTDERNWIKCSPNLDVTVSIDWLRSQVQQAKQNPSDEVGVKTKNLNIWCDSSNVWIPEHYIKSQMKKIELSDFIGRDDILVYAGVDLSSVSDLTAVSYMIFDTNNNNYYFKTYYYLPESCVEDKFNKELYKIWASHGELKLTKGNVVDYNYITNDLKYWYEKLNIRKIAYDAWNATQWSVQCKDEGLPIEPFSQSIGNFNRATKEMERIILSEQAYIDRNNITRFCFDNVELRVDMNGNSKPSKEVSQKKIDGVISMIEALGVYLLDNHGSGEIMVF